MKTIELKARQVIQSILRHYGYQLIRNTRPEALVGVDHDAGASIPDDLAQELRVDNPKLADLSARYRNTKLPMLLHTWWNGDYIERTVDLLHFRGDNAYVWQKRHMPDGVEHRYYLYACDVEKADALDLFSRLSEDGAFGAWVFRFRRFPALSRDLLDSVNELNFLAKHSALSTLDSPSILDIGAGYGRLAHRTTEAVGNLKTYFCVDAVPESTFLCDIYLRYRNCEAKTKVIPIDQLAALDGHRIDLAVNVHSFSEMCLEAIEGWLDLVRRLRIPQLFIVPNDAEAFLTMEADGTRKDFLTAIESRGYRLVAKQPAITDLDVRELVGVHDYHFLFARSD